MASLTPAQYYDHVLNVVSGSDGMHDLQYRAAPASTATEFDRGSLVTLDSAGKVVAGADSTHAMPLFAINSTEDFDVEADVGNISGGYIACFVATGGYEIFTTEFVSGSYAPNDMLTAATGGDAGKVTEAGANYNDSIVVGCVSQGETTDAYSQAILYFWPMFIPENKVT